MDTYSFDDNHVEEQERGMSPGWKFGIQATVLFILCFATWWFL